MNYPIRNRYRLMSVRAIWATFIWELFTSIESKSWQRENQADNWDDMKSSTRFHKEKIESSFSLRKMSIGKNALCLLTSLSNSIRIDSILWKLRYLSRKVNRIFGSDLRFRDVRAFWVNQKLLPLNFDVKLISLCSNEKKKINFINKFTITHAYDMHEHMNWCFSIN